METPEKKELLDKLSGVKELLNRLIKTVDGLSTVIISRDPQGSKQYLSSLLKFVEEIHAEREEAYRKIVQDNLEGRLHSAKEMDRAKNDCNETKLLLECGYDCG